VVKDTSQVKVVRHKEGKGINRSNKIHVILYPVQVSGFEAHHGMTECKYSDTSANE